MKKALTIAGSDSGGCAGIQADIKTFQSLGVFGTSAITCVTAQNTEGVLDIAALPPENVAKQIGAVFEDMGADALKIGMLFSKSIIDVVLKILLKYAPKNVVLDPVIASTTGAALLQDDAAAALEKLFPFARIVTPNVKEAEFLTGTKINSYDDKVKACQIMLRKGAQTVIIKGGDAGDDNALDVWHNGKTVFDFSSSRIDTKNLHGTGCTFSAAIAAFLAKGCMLDESIRRAKNYITGAIQSGAAMNIGKGAGPVDHLWQTK